MPRSASISNVAPSNAESDGQLWESLGAYQIKSGTAYISLSDMADGGVMADAVCAAAVAPPTPARTAAEGTGDPGYSEAGSGWLGLDDDGAYEGGFRYASAGTGQNTAGWTFAVQPGFLYHVNVTWSAGPDRADNAPFTVFDGNKAVTTVLVNQQLAPSGTSSDGQTWQGIYSFRPKSNTVTVRLSDNADGYVIANAVELADPTLYWDPSGNTNTASINISTGAGLGGSGTWSSSSAAWYNPDTETVVSDTSGYDLIVVGNHGETSPTVTTSGAISVNGEVFFQTAGYTLQLTGQTDVAADGDGGLTMVGGGVSLNGYNLTVGSLYGDAQQFHLRRSHVESCGHRRWRLRGSGLRRLLAAVDRRNAHHGPLRRQYHDRRCHADSRWRPRLRQLEHGGQRRAGSGGK